MKQCFLIIATLSMCNKNTQLKLAFRNAYMPLHKVENIVSNSILNFTLALFTHGLNCYWLLVTLKH